jgi:hypothetical protein
MKRSLTFKEIRLQCNVSTSHNFKTLSNETYYVICCTKIIRPLRCCLGLRATLGTNHFKIFKIQSTWYETWLKLVCMYVCMYICIYVYMHVYMYVCMYACMHAITFMCHLSLIQFSTQMTHKQSDWQLQISSEVEDPAFQPSQWPFTWNIKTFVCNMASDEETRLLGYYTM